MRKILFFKKNFENLLPLLLSQVKLSYERQKTPHSVEWGAVLFRTSLFGCFQAADPRCQPLPYAQLQIYQYLHASASLLWK